MTGRRRAWIKAGLCGLTLAVLGAAGCGSRPPAPAGTIWVTGEISSSGKPLPFGVIQFFAKESGSSGSVRIKHGRFGLWLKPGSYNVAVIAEETPGHEDGKGGYVPAISIIPERYGDIATSKLEADVNDRSTHVRIELEG